MDGSSVYVGKNSGGLLVKKKLKYYVKVGIRRDVNHGWK